MKFPKNRANIYIVVRVDLNENPDKVRTAILGTFADVVDADDFKDSCAAEWFDKNGYPSVFEVRLSTFYG